MKHYIAVKINELYTRTQMNVTKNSIEQRFGQNILNQIVVKLEWK